MHQIPFLTITEQVVERLRAAIISGQWTDALPGRNQLASEFGINPKTAESALRQLEIEGIIQSQGAGRKRRITPKAQHSPRVMRVAFLPFDLATDRKEEYMVEFQHTLEEMGHSVFYTPRSLNDLRFDLTKIKRMVAETPADAWVVLAGSRDILQWFAQRPEPAFALFGERAGLPMAGFGPDKVPAMVDSIRKLKELGHQRIVLLCRRARRQPEVNRSVGAFVDELQRASIPCSDYNLPNWEETSTGYQRCLESLFRITPPTALIVDESTYMVATMQFLLRRGIRVPEEVSLICTDYDPVFVNCDPPISCMTWDIEPLKKRILQWAKAISCGKSDLRNTNTPAKFIIGGTISQAKAGGR